MPSPGKGSPKKLVSKPKAPHCNAEDVSRKLINQCHSGSPKTTRFRDLVTCKMTAKSSGKNRKHNIGELSRPFSGRPLSCNATNLRGSPKTRRSSQTEEAFLEILKNKTESSAIASLTTSVRNREKKTLCSRPKMGDRFKFQNRIMSGTMSKKYVNKQLHTNKELISGTAPSSELELVKVNNVDKTGIRKEKIKEKEQQKEKEGDEAKTKSVYDQWYNKELRQDEQMVLLENFSFVFLPQSDDSDHLKGMPITFETAKNLRLLLFGSVAHSFKQSWREQYLVFHKANHYGLKFFKDGPKELMVSLQAYILKHLLFLNIEPTKIIDLAERLSPSENTQQRCLVLAICDMIWKCGERKHAVVALPIGKSSFVGDCHYREDHITEKMELFKFINSDDLEKFVCRNIYLFQNPNSHGCISLLYSLMLSRGLSRLRSDFCTEKRGMLETKEDDPPFHSQALVNLAISGTAVPNVFNYDVEVYNEADDKLEYHKGISGRNEFGYLDHREFVDCKQLLVGSCLKTPLYPIWIAKHDSRLCVLFCLKKDLLNDWKLERHFDLYHYQGIPRFVEVLNVDVKLTINTILYYPINLVEEEEPSELEETITTKWSEAVIDWNGYPRF